MVEPEQWRPEVEEVEEAWLKASATIDVANGHRLDKYGDEFASYIHRRESPVATEKDDTTNNILNGPGDFPSFYPLLESSIATRVDDKTINMKNEPGDFRHFFHQSEWGSGNKRQVLPVGITASGPVATEEDDTTIDMNNEPGDFIDFFHGSCRKVMGYRRYKNNIVNEQDIPVEPEPIPDLENLVGFLSCLSLFTSSDNGCFSPFDIFRRPNRIYYEPEPVVIAPSSGRSWLGYDGFLAEILKSIVYGGLMEVIISLSVVASAAASDATTLSIISVALASLMGGVFIIGHNLWGLRDDCSKDSSNNKAVSKYKELLGQVKYFPLHAFFTILSFLVFGMVPLVAYGYAFHETNDKDSTVAAVATTSLICVTLLAILKAYNNKCTVIEYFKTVVYYVTTTVSVSGVSYVVGNLVTMLMEEYGLFGRNSGGEMSLFPDATASLASI